jgi:hypothetical protein
MVEKAEALFLFKPEKGLFKNIEKGIGEKIEKVMDDPDSQCKREEDD